MRTSILVCFFLVPTLQANAQHIIVLDGATVNFQCTPSNDALITWYFNGTIISDGSLSPPNLYHMLTLTGAAVSNSGVYKCQFVTTVFEVVVSREISLTVHEGEPQLIRIIQV